MDAIVVLFAFVILSLLLLVIGVLGYLLLKANKEKDEHQKALSQLRREVSTIAKKDGMELLEDWRKSELENLRAEIRKNLQESIGSEYKIKFADWKKEFEKSIREDSATRSQSTLIGKITEHFIPYLPDFSYNPQDARFLGAPIDFIVFDGLSEGDIKQVVLIEVKTNKGSLTTRERQIRNAVNEGKVQWVQLRRSVELESKVTEEQDKNIQIVIN